MQSQADKIREISRDFGFLIVTEALFLAIVSLALWALGRPAAAGRVAGGFALFYLAMWIIFLISVFAMRRLRINDDDHPDAYVLLNLAAGGVPLLAWGAFAATTMRTATAGASLPAAGLLWFLGLFTAWMAYGVTSTYYPGSLYRRIHLPLALGSYTLAALLSALGPAAGRGTP